MRNALTLAVICCLCAGTAAASGPGSSAADYLACPPTARAAAQADGGVALAYDDPSVALTNPAALAGLTRPRMSFNYAALAAGIPYNLTTLAVPTGVGIMGATIIYVPYGSMDGYDNTGAQVTVPSSYDTAFVMSYALPLRRTVPVVTDYGSVGLSLKFLHGALAYYTMESLALDAGAIVRVPFVRGLTAGVSYRNMSTGARYVNETRQLVGGPVAGLAYSNPAWWDLALTADWIGAENGPARGAAGISVAPVYFLVLRAGIKDDGRSLVSGARAGFGLRFGGISADYALTPLADFSPRHAVSVNIPIGDIAGLDAASDYYLTQHFRRACETYYARDYIAARQQFEEILSVYPDHGPSQRYLVKIIAAIEQMDQRKQETIETWLARADRAFERKDFVTAGRYYTRVLRIASDSGMAKAGVDRIHGMIDEVRRQKMLQRNQESVNRIWNRSVSQYRRGDYVRAKDGFKEILSIDPQNAEAKKFIVEIDNQLSKVAASRVNDLFSRAMRLYKDKEYAEAMKYFDAVFIAAPHRLDAQDYAFKCQEAIDDAARRTREAQVAREQEKVRSEMAGTFDKALKFYEKGAYDNAFEWFTKSERLAAQYEFAEYRENARNYLALVRNTLAERHYKRGYNHFRANDILRAAEQYRKALEYEPENRSARAELDRLGKTIAQKHFEQGMEFFSLGQMEKAREAFKKSLEYQPDKIEAQRALDRIK